MAVTRYEDTDLHGVGVIWKDSSSPYTISSSDGWQSLLTIDYQSSPVSDATVPNPWYLRWRLADSYMTKDIFDVKNVPLMEMRLQYSADATTWTNFKACDIVPYRGETGRLAYDPEQATYPRYIRAIGRIFPKTDTTATSVTMLMGMENFKP